MAVYPHRHDAKARVYTDAKGLLWVTHNDLLEAEYEALEDFSIVYLNGKFYELQGYSETPDAWWIEEVPMDSDAVQIAAAELSREEPNEPVE